METEGDKQSVAETQLQAEEKKAMRNITALGWVSFFGGLSQDMIVPILPMFYTQVLGISKETIGLLEGSMATVVSIFKVSAGIVSDKVGQRKPIVFTGYLFSAIGRLLLAFAGQLGAVGAGRPVGRGPSGAPSGLWLLPRGPGSVCR